MKLSRSTLKTILVAVIAGVLAYVNFPVPKDSIEDVVDSVLETTAEATTSSVGEVSTVTKIVDGDTFKVSQNGKEVTVRVLGIDTPETEFSPAGAECFGDEATIKAKELLTGTSVVLRTDTTQGDFDKYGRLLAYVEVNSTFDFGERMISEGFAKEYTYNKAYENQTVYKSLENQAKQFKKGLWSMCGE